MSWRRHALRLLTIAACYALVDAALASVCTSFSSPEVCGNVLFNSNGPFSVEQSPFVPLSFVTAGPGVAGGNAVGQGPSGSASAAGDFGTLHALASASSSLTEPDSLGLFLNAQANVGFFDDGTVRSTFVRIGVPVVVRFTFTIHGSASRGANGGGSLDVLALGPNGFFVNPGGSCTQTGTIQSTGLETIICDEPFKVGDVVGFEADIGATAQVSNRCGSCVPITDAIADLLDTGQLFIDVLTPGVTLDAVSGHDYSSATNGPAAPAPEPGTLALLSLAIAGLGFSRDRRPN